MENFPWCYTLPCSRSFKLLNELKNQENGIAPCIHQLINYSSKYEHTIRVSFLPTSLLCRYNLWSLNANDSCDETVIWASFAARSRVLARLASLAQIGELARGLESCSNVCFQNRTKKLLFPPVLVVLIGFEAQWWNNSTKSNIVFVISTQIRFKVYITSALFFLLICMS